MGLHLQKITTPAAAGSAGVATATITVPVETQGKLEAVALDYDAATPATADVTVTLIDPLGVSKVLLTKTNSGTDMGLTELLQDGITAAGAAASVLKEQPLLGQVKVDVAQSDPTKVLRVLLVVSDG